MPIGAGRASEYAGWWTGKPSFLSRSLVSGAQDNTWPNAISITPNQWNTPTSGAAFSNTSVTSGAKGTTALTFKYQAASNFTWTTNAYRTTYQNIKNNVSDSAYYDFVTNYYCLDGVGFSQSWAIGPARTVSGGYLSLFTSFNGYDFTKLTGNITWDSLADRWLTAIISYSSSTSDFAGWAGGALISGNYASRILLQDAHTGEQLSVTDWQYSAFQGYSTNWADYTWSWSSSIAVGSYYYDFGIPNGYFDQTDILLGASWHTQGQLIDPTATASSVKLSNYFVGNYFTETVNGVRAWSNWTPVATSAPGSTTYLTRALPARVSSTSNYMGQRTTTNLTSPYTDTSRP